MFRGLGEERTRFRKKKWKKEEKKLIAAQSGLVGMKGNFKTYNHVKHFLPYLSRFLMRLLFNRMAFGSQNLSHVIYCFEIQYKSTTD